jgi:DNA polymerase-3 subunit epsilon
MELSNNLIAIDVETTGENPFIHDVLSVALVPVIAQWEPLVVHVRHHEPEWSDFGRRNFALFTQEWNRTAITPPEAIKYIERYLDSHLAGGTATLVGHNVGFDLTFLRKLASQGGRSSLPAIGHRTLDTHTLLYMCWLQGRIPEEARTSEGAFAAFGITVDKWNRHTALADAIATKTLFLRLVDLLVHPVDGGVTKQGRAIR